MSDQPGKVLSSLHTSSDKHHSKLGVYAGVFFQLFDWNHRLNGKRLLPHKLVPAERPSKQASKGRKDEKLPMAKLLLIADENRGGFPKALQTDSGEPCLKEKTPEKKKKKSQSPSVVAKLMGLEAMPSPESVKDQKQGMDSTTNICADANVNLSQGQHVPCLATNASVHGRPQCALVCHKSEDSKVSFFCKLPALSPRKADRVLRSILSPSKSHNKLLSPIKSPLATKSAARLLEAATKILEPNMQPSIRARSLGSNSHAAKSLPASEDQKAENKPCQSAMAGKKKPTLGSEIKKQTQSISLCPYKDPTKAQKKVKQDKSPGNVPDVNAMCQAQPKRGSSVLVNRDSLKRSGSTREESVPLVNHLNGQLRLIRSKSVKDELASIKVHHKDVRICKEDKVRGDRRKQQQEISNTLSHSASSVKRGGDRVKQDTDGSSMDGTMLGLENQNPNRVRATNLETSKGSLVEATVVSSASSGILKYGRFFSSQKAITGREPSNKAQKNQDSSVMKSFLRKKGFNADNVAKRGPKSVSKNLKLGDANCDQTMSALEKQVPSMSKEECVTAESISEREDLSPCSTFAGSSLMSSDHLELNLDSSDKTSITCSSNHMDSSSNGADALDNGPMEGSIHSTCESSAGDVVDSASSPSAYLELEHQRTKRPVSYSGKTTAAILQELLMALNSTKTQLTRVNTSVRGMPDGDHSASSSKFSICPQLGTDCEESATSASSTSHHPTVTPMSVKGGGEGITEWRHPSPVSTLEAPFDDESSTLSKSFDDVQARRLLSRVAHEKQHDASRRNVKLMQGDKNDSKQAFHCEEQYIEVVVSSAKLSPVDIYAVKLQCSCPLVDRALFGSLEEQYYQQWEWGIQKPGNSKPSGMSRSDTEMRFMRSLYAEAGAQNRKLVFDSISEALHIQFGVNEWSSCQCFPAWTLPSSPMHVANGVCRQIHTWKGLASCTNIDDMVDQAMSTGFGKWVDFSEELSDLAVDMEGSLLSALIDDLVDDLGRKLPIMVIRQGSRKNGNRKGRVRGLC